MPYTAIRSHAMPMPFSGRKSPEEILSMDSASKLHFIELLASSIVPAEEKQAVGSEWVDMLCGSWVDDRSTSEIVDDIRNKWTV